MRSCRSISKSTWFLFCLVVPSYSLQCPFAHVGQQHKTISTIPSSPSYAPPQRPVPEPDGIALTPLESWAYSNLEATYKKALSIKCPFFRRRASDLLDGADMIMRFLVIRHKTLLGPPPAWRCADAQVKHRGITLKEAYDIIKDDWKSSTNKGYYITGKLNTTIYRDDCFFDGPDPDMPVKGLRKYLNAASQLFDQGKSRSQLLSLEILDNGTIEAKWKMTGTLRLPWKPQLPNWTGTTTYHFDTDGLIYKHEETWDMSVVQAFLRTLWPALARRIWDREVRPTDLAT